MKPTEPPVARLHELLVCDPETGVVRWRVSRGGCRAGAIAGCVDPSTGGYRRIQVDGKNILEHRIVWAMTKGAWPLELLDHRNGKKTDNRIANLREVTHAENSHNRGKTSRNTSGSIGVSWRKERRKWRAIIGVNGRNKYLGHFATKKEARAAYDKAKRIYHPSASFVRIAADAGLPLWKAAS